MRKTPRETFLAAFLLTLLIIISFLLTFSRLPRSIPISIKHKLQRKPPGIYRMNRIAVIHLDQPMRQFISKVWPERITKKCSYFKRKVFTKYLIHLWKVHQRAQAILIFYSINT